MLRHLTREEIYLEGHAVDPEMYSKLIHIVAPVGKGGFSTEFSSLHSRIVSSGMWYPTWHRRPRRPVCLRVRRYQSSLNEQPLRSRMTLIPGRLLSIRPMS